jgi:hypothetical protein
MYDLEAASGLENLGRRDERLLRQRNAHLFKSLEVPYGSIGGIHKHSSTTRANGNYDKVLMNWAESEFESS